MSMANENERRSTNGKIARNLIAIGVPVFVSSGKVPLVTAFNQLDTDITPEQRDSILTKYAAEHDGQTPKFIGATLDLSKVKAFFHSFPDAVTSIACGPANLVVFDADKKNDGPNLLGAFIAEQGGMPKGALCIPTKSGGEHWYFLNAQKLSNRSGAFGRDMGTDVRGMGGQTVAPGSWREDGKRYGSDQDFARFCRAIVSKSLVPVPQFMVDKIGEASGQIKEGEASDDKISAGIKHLDKTDWPEYADIFEGDLALYDLKKVAYSDTNFDDALATPSDNYSDSRFAVA